MSDVDIGHNYYVLKGVMLLLLAIISDRLCWASVFLQVVALFFSWILDQTEPLL